MDKSERTLRKLVALKRQIAEQKYAVIQADVRKDEKTLASLKADLKASDDWEGDFQATSLSRQFGHVALALQRIDAAKAGLDHKRQCLSEAREALKKALDSEQRLEGAGKPK